MISYGYVKEVNRPLKQVLSELPALLEKECFGVLSEIRMDQKFQEKLGVEFPAYTILGICNPPLAYKAVQVEETIGLMLPCNIIVYDKGGNTMVGVVKPTVMMGMVDNDELLDVADEVEDKLKRIFELI